MSCSFFEPTKKLNSAAYLANQLSSQLLHVSLSSNELIEIQYDKSLLTKLTKIMSLILLLLKKARNPVYTGAYRRRLYLKISIIIRLLSILKTIYNDSVYYENYNFNYLFKTNYPEIYNSVILQRINAKTAYNWCKTRSNRGHEFLKSIANLINPEIHLTWERILGGDEDQMFIRELVRLLGRYQTTTILITALNKKIIQLSDQLNEARTKVFEYESYFRALEIGGGLQIIEAISPNVDLIDSNFLVVSSVDGKGKGAVLNIRDDRIKITKIGKDYTVNEIISVTFQGDIYYFKVIHLTNPEDEEGTFSVATKIDLDQIDVHIPIWTRLYTYLYPASFDLKLLCEVKDEVLEYGIQYVLLKHGNPEDIYDQTLTRAF